MGYQDSHASEEYVSGLEKDLSRMHNIILDRETRIDDLEAKVKELKERLTCKSGGSPHYCPNCDNTFGPED